MSTGKWMVEYENDTGAHDDCFREWWTVTDGHYSFACANEEGARFLAGALNRRVDARKADEEKRHRQSTALDILDVERDIMAAERGMENTYGLPDEMFERHRKDILGVLNERLADMRSRLKPRT